MHQVMLERQSKLNELNQTDTYLDGQIVDTYEQINKTKERLDKQKETLEQCNETEQNYAEQIESAKEKIGRHKNTLERLVVENNEILTQLRINRETRENRRKELEREVEEVEGRAKQQIENIQQSVINETRKLSEIQNQQENMMRMFRASLDDVNKIISEQKNVNMSETYRCSICMDHVADASINCGHIFCGTCLIQFNECPICHMQKPEAGFDVRKLYFV